MLKPAVIAAIVLVTPHAFAGDLNPPPGAISATMQSLDAIEPRVCVNDLPGDEGAVHIISEDGNYYLCADIFGEPGKSGIVINADNVTIDGRGFRMVGGPGSDVGIRSGVGSASPKTCRPNRIDMSLWGGGGIDLDAGGIAGSRILIEDVTVTGSGGDGILVQDCPDFGMSRCVCRDNAGHGVHTIGCASETAFDCEASGNALSGFRSNGSGTARGVCRHGRCFARANGDDGWSIARDDGTISLDACVATDNIGDGVEVAGQPGALSWADIFVANGACTGNGGEGLRISPGAIVGIAIGVVNVRCVSNGGSGIDVRCDDNATSARCVIDGCPLNDNGAAGLTARVLSLEVSSSSCEGNSLDGMSCTTDSCVIDDVTLFRNGGDGLRGLGPIREPWKKTRLREVRSHCNMGDGVDLTDADLHATNFDISNNVGAGVRCVGGPVRCADGSCRSNGAGGVLLTDCVSSHLERCRCESNTGDGLAVSGGGTLTVHVCHFLTNSASGMGFASDSPVYVGDSTFSDNPLYGATCASGPGGGCTPHFSVCHFVRNGSDGLFVGGAAGGVVRDCSATGNGGAGVRLGTSPTLSVTGMQVDRCFASGNNEGLVVADAQNTVQRCVAVQNLTTDLSLHGETAASASSTEFPTWGAAVHHAWPSR